MVGFPTCVKCDCNPDGTKLVPGRIKSMCYGSAKVRKFVYEWVEDMEFPLWACSQKLITSRHNTKTKLRIWCRRWTWSFTTSLTIVHCVLFSQYQCLCKSHVVGRTCDRCMHGYYNFTGNNPSGCSACRCLSRGTISGTRNCHAQNGRCNCKNHATGAKCDRCKDGYHGMKQHDVFGCKGQWSHPCTHALWS